MSDFLQSKAHHPSCTRSPRPRDGSVCGCREARDARITYAIYSARLQAYLGATVGRWTSWAREAHGFTSAKEATDYLTNTLGMTNTTRADVANGAYVVELTS